MFDFREYFTGQIQGGTTDGFMNLMDKLIDEGGITQKYFDVHELEIAEIFDDGFFTCAVCDWTVPMDCVSTCEDELICDGCYDGEDDE